MSRLNLSSNAGDVNMAEPAAAVAAPSGALSNSALSAHEAAMRAAARSRAMGLTPLPLPQLLPMPAPRFNANGGANDYLSRSIDALFGRVSSPVAIAQGQRAAPAAATAAPVATAAHLATADNADEDPLASQVYGGDYKASAWDSLNIDASDNAAGGGEDETPDAAAPAQHFKVECDDLIKKILKIDKEKKQLKEEDDDGDDVDADAMSAAPAANEKLQANIAQLEETVRQKIGNFNQIQHVKVWLWLTEASLSEEKKVLVAKYLIKYGADINAQAGNERALTVVVFSSKKSIKLVKFFIDQGVDYTYEIRRNAGAHNGGMITCRLVDYFNRIKGGRYKHLKTYFNTLILAEKSAKKLKRRNEDSDQEGSDDQCSHEDKDKKNGSAAAEAADTSAKIDAKQDQPKRKKQKNDSTAAAASSSNSAVAAQKDESLPVVVKKEPGLIHRALPSKVEIEQAAATLRGNSRAGFNCARYAIDVKNFLMSGVMPEKSTDPKPGSVEVGGFVPDRKPITIKTEDGRRVPCEELTNITVLLRSALFKDALPGGSFYESGDKVFIDGIDLTQRGQGGMYHSEYKNFASDIQQKANTENNVLIGTLLLLYANPVKDGFLKKFSGHFVAFRAVPGEAAPIFIDCMNPKATRVFSNLESMYTFSAAGAAAATSTQTIPFAKQCAYALHDCFPYTAPHPLSAAAAALAHVATVSAAEPAAASASPSPASASAPTASVGSAAHRQRKKMAYASAASGIRFFHSGAPKTEASVASDGDVFKFVMVSG